MIKNEKVLVLDCGGCNSQLIARKIRNCGVYCHVKPCASFSLRDAAEYQGIVATRAEACAVLAESELPVFDIAVRGEAEADLKGVSVRYMRMQWEMGNVRLHRRISCRNSETDRREKVLCALSGGVDSRFPLCWSTRPSAKNLTCIFVNHGLMRKDEPEMVEQVFRKEYDINLICIDAVDRFLDKLAGVTDPERKRKIIGEEFIRVFEEEAKSLGKLIIYAKGQFIPISWRAGSAARPLRATIMSADCRSISGLLGLWSRFVTCLKTRCEKLVWNLVCRKQWYGASRSQPWAWGACHGCNYSRKSCIWCVKRTLSSARKLAKAGLDKEINQYFAVIPGIRNVGVTGGRTYEETIALGRL